MTTLLVTSDGGHLAELHELLPRLSGIDDDRLWITFDTPQTRSLLADERVQFVDYTDARDVRRVLGNSRVAMRLFGRGHPFTTAVSTGSAIALSFLPVAQVRGVACHFIESATRSTGPSVTGRLLMRIPGLTLYCQYPGWATPPWRYEGSVLDGYVRGPNPVRPAAVRTIVVTVGTLRYPFRSLVERALEILPSGGHVIWQVGWTDVDDLPITSTKWLAPSELAEAIRAADVVVSHAGVGSALMALEAGKCPILVPRRASHRENVDDHQALIAAELGRRELALVRPIDELGPGDLEQAANMTVRRNEHSQPFRLVGRRGA